MAKATRARVKLVVSLLRRFSNVIDVAKLGISKGFAELNYKKVM